MPGENPLADLQAVREYLVDAEWLSHAIYHFVKTAGDEAEVPATGVDRSNGVGRSRGEFDGGGNIREHGIR